MNTPIYHVFVGFDTREPEAYEVCEYSLQQLNGDKVCIHKLDHRDLRRRNLFYRKWMVDEDGQYWDEADGKPFSTEFAHTRFLVPEIAKQEGLQDLGWVLFCDGDFLFRKPLDELFANVNNDYAAMCVKFDFTEEEKDKKLLNRVKMDGRKQTVYHRKLWSSFVLWNINHPANNTLSTIKVNEATGGSLHAFSWLSDEDIGEVSPDWNYIPNLSKMDQQSTGAKAIHYSLGGPWFAQNTQTLCADQWKRIYKKVCLKKAHEMQGSLINSSIGDRIKRVF